VVPTIADLLDTEIWWDHDGYSVFSPVSRARQVVAMPRRDFSRTIFYTREEFERRREELRSWRASKFGTGVQSELTFGDPWASAYRIGPHSELIGRAVGGVRTAARVSGEVANAQLLEDVDPADPILPTRVTGQLAGGSTRSVRDLAVAVNGRIRAVGRSFHLRGRRAEYFSLLLPESALRPGGNFLQLLEVRPGGELRSLAEA
jgi:hypothetical protein